VRQARQLVGLQCSARGRQQKFPGSLGSELGHDNLRGGVEGYDDYINLLVIHAASNLRVNMLWKHVEKPQPFLSLCSSCTGDYEDPDRTTWTDDPSEDEELSDSTRKANYEEMAHATAHRVPSFPQALQAGFATDGVTNK
jgi:hypothetical protein